MNSLLILVLLRFPTSDQSLVAFPSDDASTSEGSCNDTLSYDPRGVPEALEFGIREATRIVQQSEPPLYASNSHFIGVSDSATNDEAERAKNLSRIADGSLQATLALKKRSLSAFQARREYTAVPTSKHDLPINCLNKMLPQDCSDTSRIYRTPNGTCNNLRNPSWGLSFEPFARFLPSEYGDDVSSIRKSVGGDNLPSASKIAKGILGVLGGSKTSAVHSQMMKLWGEFLSLDLSLTPDAVGLLNSVPKCCNVHQSHPDCLPIVVDDDPETNCLEFFRTSPSPRPHCGFGAREQLNQGTSWLDGSEIYGSTEEAQRSLRLSRGGKLKHRRVSGNSSQGENKGLEAMYTVWLRQHNLLTEKLAVMNPQWSEETMFQETRKIVMAQLQHITFREFLPLLLGPNAVKTFGLRALRTGYYDGYNNTVNPTVPNSFGTAAFRFGQASSIPQRPPRGDKSTDVLTGVNSSIERMARSEFALQGKLDPVVLALASTQFQKRSIFTTKKQSNKQTKFSGNDGHDLVAIIMQRGRDHGLAPYLKWRQACGLLRPINHNGPVVTWDDFAEATSLHRDKVQALASVYRNPWDVDLYPGGVLEVPVRGGLVGPTFACIVGQTFRNARKGDRFWYDTRGQFNLNQLQAIRKTSLARVLCDTSQSISTIQPVVFLAAQLQRNPSVSCSNSDAIPIIDLIPWKHSRFAEGPLHYSYSIVEPGVESHPPSFYSLGNPSTDSGKSSEERIIYKLNFTRS